MLPLTEDTILVVWFCQYTARMVYLDGHGNNAQGHTMEEISAGGCAYIFLVSQQLVLRVGLAITIVT